MPRLGSSTRPARPAGMRCMPLGGGRGVRGPLGGQRTAHGTRAALCGRACSAAAAVRGACWFKTCGKASEGQPGQGPSAARAREKGEGVRINCAGVSISYFSSSAGRGVQGGKATKSRLALRKITGATRRRPGPTAKFPLTPARARRRRLGTSRAAPRASR